MARPRKLAEVVEASKSLEPAFKAACSQIEHYIKDGVNEGEEEHAGLTIRTIAAFSKLRQVETQEKGLKFAVARVMAGNVSELKKLIKSSLPELK